MSSLKLLMQNYSDSEDGSSDEEKRNAKRLKRKSKDEEQIKQDLNEDESSSSQQQAIKLIKTDEKSSDDDTVSPSLDKMKINEKKIDYDHHHQGYLEDDFFTVPNNEIDDEDDVDSDNNSSIIEFDKNEKPIDNVSTIADFNHHNQNNDDDNQNDKSDYGKYSPKSYHRQLIGINEDDIQIPDPPTKQCSTELIEKVIYYHNKMKQGMDMNASIQSKKLFRNPSIYEKLIAFCNIDEFGTNLPPEIFDPNQFRDKETNEHDTST